MADQTAVIIGGGPAGLAAAWHLLERTRIRPILLEATSCLGGIARTAAYRGNRMDMGGHRFFSKSRQVMDWWLRILPMQGSPARDDLLLDRRSGFSDHPGAPDPELTDRVMLLRRRFSRISFLGKFFDYPLAFNRQTLSNLGLRRLTGMSMSYLQARLHPIAPERNLEDFIVNRFGRRLYETFFRDYTTKVWGVSPTEIPPDWGAQRIKGVSVAKVVANAARKLASSLISSTDQTADIAQENQETSLIERFCYPKLGPGQLWEEVARQIEARGGRILFNHPVVALQREGQRITTVIADDLETGKYQEFPADHIFSSMPIRDLIAGLDGETPDEVRDVASGLVYRDFFTVGLLLRKLRTTDASADRQPVGGLIPDLWIYIQEAAVALGRLQIFNNWSPYLVKDFPDRVWLGLEYFCTQGDPLWNSPDRELIDLAIAEAAKIRLIDRSEVLDACLARVPLAYPAYFGSYSRFDQIRAFLDTFENLYPIGRNGMHRYNNMDHSVLTAMTAVDLASRGDRDRSRLWAVNAEEAYHEEAGEPPRD